jgi:hypothetical protein
VRPGGRYRGAASSSPEVRRCQQGPIGLTPASDRPHAR